MKYLKTFENNKPQPKFKKGDEVIIIYDLAMFMGSYYDMRKGDLVTITGHFINANNDIFYYIDSPKLRKNAKGNYIKIDYFPEFNFEYEYVVAAKNFNL